MKTLRASLMATVALGVFALPVAADPLGSWDTVINGPGRFRVLSAFNNAAVMDRETGLVWERSPDSVTRDWIGAHRVCVDKAVGIPSRKGWRVPTLQELASLVDPTQDRGTGPALPVGHPFTNVRPDFYWSATTFGENPTYAWGVAFVDGILIEPGARFTGKTAQFFVWCVRSGHGGPDVQ
jgi:hypothetical protein